MDLQGTVLAANDGLARLVGRQAEDMSGRPFEALLAGASRVLYHTYLQPLLRLHGHVEEVAIALATPGGDPVDVLFYSTRQRDAQGVEHTEVLLAPIRRRRGIEDELLRVKRAADQSPGMIFQLVQRADGRLCFSYVSEAVRRLYGVSPDAAMESAQAVLERIEELDRQSMLHAIQAAALEGHDWIGVFRVRDSRSGVRWHELHCTPRILSSGEKLWHGHIADVTARRELERNLAERDACDRADRMRSEFLARVSHELRTPLNAIIGFAQLLETDASENLGNVQRHRLGIVRSSGQHLLGLVNQVLEISTLEATQARPELLSLSLDRVIHEAMDLVRGDAQAAGIEFGRLDCDAGLQVRAHPLWLRQVLVNLLTNAVKYNRPGGRVVVSASRRAQQVRVSVSDTGVGLSSSQQAQLFQAFNRLGAQNTSAEGTGLGLVITKRLLALMDGQIEVRSAEGAGSTFSVVLGSASTGPSDASGGAERPLPVAGTATHGTVLYVEDNPMNVLLMEAIVALRPGLSMRVASSGAAALEMLSLTRPELLLLDIHLPDTSGLQLLARLREMPGLAAVPAIAVSAAAQADDVRTALAGGFDAYWTKPLDIGHTLAEFDRWLGATQSAGLPPCLNP